MQLRFGQQNQLMLGNVCVFERKNCFVTFQFTFTGRDPTPSSRDELVATS